MELLRSLKVNHAKIISAAANFSEPYGLPQTPVVASNKPPACPKETQTRLETMSLNYMLSGCWEAENGMEQAQGSILFVSE